MKNAAFLLLPGWLVIVSQGYRVGPDYHTPVSPLRADARWKIPQSSDHAIKGDWCKSFHDPVLDELELRNRFLGQGTSIV